MNELEQAAQRAREAAIAEQAPRLVDAAARAYAGDRLGGARLDALLSNMDARRFVDEHGAVDTARLHTLVDAVGDAAAPATRIDMGQGVRAPGEARGATVEAGAAEWRASNPLPAAAAAPTASASDAAAPSKPAARGGLAAGAELYRQHLREQRFPFI